MIEILRIESCACIVNKQTLVLSNHGTWNKFFLLHNSDYTLDLDSGKLFVPFALVGAWTLRRNASAQMQVFAMHSDKCDYPCSSQSFLAEISFLTFSWFLLPSAFSTAA